MDTRFEDRLTGEVRMSPVRTCDDWHGHARRLTAIALAIFVMHAPIAGAQPEPAPSATPAAPPLTALAGQIELARLVDLAARRLRINVQYDASVLKGSVTLRLEGSVSDDELWSLTNRALAASGFTSVRPAAGSAVYQIVKIQEAAALATVEPPAPSPSPAIALPPAPPTPPAGFRVALFRVRSRPAKEIVEALKLVISKTGGSVSEVAGSFQGSAVARAPSNADVHAGDVDATEQAGASANGGGLIVVADLEPRVREAQRLITLLDVPRTPGTADERASTQFLPVRNLAPTALVALVQQVAAKRELVTGEKIAGELVALPSGTQPPGEANHATGGGVAGGGGGGVGGVGGVLLVAPPEHVEYWTTLVRQLDQREPVETRAYTPRYFAVKEVARLVEQSVRESGSGGGTGGQSDDRWRLVVDDLTGSFLATATPSQHEKIEAVLQRLDSVPASARRPVRSYKVRNRGVHELLAVLNDLIRSGALAADAEKGTPSSATPTPPGVTTASVGTPTPATTNPPNSPWPPPTSDAKAGSAPGQPRPSPAGQAPGSAEPEITLTADEATSTIIAIGEPRLLAQLEALIRSLDVRQPQVMLEVLLVSLSDSQSLALGTELEKIEIRGDTAIRLSSLFGLSSSDFGGSAAGGGRTAPDRPGFTGIVLNPGEFSVVVRAMESLNKGRSLSIPRVLVGNNQQATFNSTLQQPFATTTISSSTGDISSQSFGGTQDAGTKVAIKPQIAEGDHLVLGYDIELSSFVGSSSGGLPPPKQQNSIQSSVSVPDGFTVVVGGLEINTDSKSTTQIPLIGSVPILGELFKNRTRDNTRSRFFVFIRANVLRHNAFEDLKYLSTSATSAAHVSDGFPDVKPQVIR
ncbi:MAG: type II secretion system protein GspD [Phycisphaerales bacterium]